MRVTDILLFGSPSIFCLSGNQIFFGGRREKGLVHIACACIGMTHAFATGLCTHTHVYNTDGYTIIFNSLRLFWGHSAHAHAMYTRLFSLPSSKKGPSTRLVTMEQIST